MFIPVNQSSRSLLKLYESMKQEMDGELDRPLDRKKNNCINISR